MISDFFLCVLATVFPVIAVWIKSGLCSDVILTIILWFCGHFPAVLYAIWVCIGRSPQQVVRVVYVTEKPTVVEKHIIVEERKVAANAEIVVDL